MMQTKQRSSVPLLVLAALSLASAGRAYRSSIDENTAMDSETTQLVGNFTDRIENAVARSRPQVSNFPPASSESFHSNLAKYRKEVFCK